MEPVTHFLTGACIGRAGLNRKTAYATLVATLAAEAADLDVLWSFAGPVEQLKHHRGITHTFLGAPLVAGTVVGAVWLFHAWRERRRRRLAVSFDKDKNTLWTSRPIRQQVRWGWLYAAALVAALSHLLLDWTNSYGLRPFFPFNPRWYAGSFVFIAEPAIWALLGAALLVPALAGLIGGEIGARRKPFRGQGWAIFALAGVVVLWCWRWAEHAQAMAMVRNTEVATEPIRRVAMEAYPLNPFRWHGILETANFFQTVEIDTRTGSIDTDPQRDVLFKPVTNPAVEAAKRTRLGRVYLDWGSWAVVRDLGPEPIPVGRLDPPELPPNRKWTTVQFTDLRFDYSYLGMGQETGLATGHSPLDGWVYIVDGRDDAGEIMSGREQK